MTALDCMRIRKGTKDEPAISKHGCDYTHMILYEAPHLYAPDSSSWDEWNERMKTLIKSFTWLLHCSHRKFWCQIIFDTSIITSLDSYLKYAPRPHDCISHLGQEHEALQRELHRLVFLVFLRIATNKESNACFLSPSAHATILYDNFVLDIPRLMDLCCLFHGNNSNLGKIIKSIFKLQPAYWSDLNETMSCITKVLQQFVSSSKFPVVDCWLLAENSSESNGPAAGDKSHLERLNLSALQDLVQYFCDIFCTVESFLVVFPASSNSIWESKLFYRFATFYESVVPELRRVLKRRKSDSRSHHSGDANLLVYDLLFTLLKRGARGILAICNATIQEQFLTSVDCPSGANEQFAVGSSNETNSVHERAEEFFCCLHHLLEFKKFIIAYDSTYDLAKQASVFSSAELDSGQFSFILEAVRSLKANSRVEVIPENVNACARLPVVSKTQPMSIQTSEMPQKVQTSVIPPSGVFVDSLISNIKDLFPDLGEGFIQKGLDVYNYNQESFVAALLEENLNPMLKDVDRQMCRQTDDEDLLVDVTRSVYDYDDFDILNGVAPDMTRLHIGKKDRHVGTNLEDDQKQYILNNYDILMEEREDIFPNTSSDADRSSLSHIRNFVTGGEMEYDDEYDDTYDSAFVASHETNTNDELLERRPFLTITEAESKRNSSLKPSHEERWKINTEETEDIDPSKPLPFCENPEVMRERREAQRATKLRNRRGFSGPPNHDVTGAPKSSSQSNTTLRNRSLKESNKATRANHSRRHLGDRKRREI